MILKTGQTLVCESEELEYEPKVHLISPYLVSGKAKVTLTPWPEYTSDTHVLLRSDDLLTVVEPREDIVKLYLNKIGKTEDDLKVTPEPVMLTEDAPDPLFEEEYEPRYVETD